MGGLIYRISDSSRIAAFCIAWLKRQPETGLTDINDDIKVEFDLVPVTGDEFDAIAGQTVDYD